MPYLYATGALVVLADPRFYPHIPRHLQVLLKLCARVDVLAVFPKNVECSENSNRVHYHRMAETIPQGVKGFAQTMCGIRQKLIQLRPDLVEAIDPPCLVASAWALCKSSSHLVYFSMEIFPELPALAKRPCKRMVWRTLERVSVLRAQRVLTVNQSVAQVISQNLGHRVVDVVRSIPEKQNPAPLSNALLCDLRALCGLHSDQFVMVYQGVVEAGRGLEPLAEALKTRPHIHLAIMGYGSWVEWAKTRSQSQANIHYLGAFPHDQLMQLSSQANAGAVCIEPISRSFELSLPGKLFEYVGNGLPVLGSSLPEIASHIQTAGVGEVAATDSPTDMGHALDRLVQGALAGRYTKALQEASEQWCWECEGLKLQAACTK